jgi:molybdate transport system permease protein
MAVDPMHAVALSIGVASMSTLLAAIPAIAVGRLLAVRDFPGKFLVSGLLLAPLVMPPVVTGLVLLDLFGKNGLFGPLLGRLGVQVVFAPLGAVLAALVVGFPLFAMATRQAFEAVDPRYEEVARTLGVPPFTTFLRVSLPLAMPGILAGAVLAFGRALGEFGATVVVAGNTEGETRTIALAIYAVYDAPGRHPELGVLLGVSLGLSLLALLGAEALSRWQRRRLEIRRG